MTNEIFNKIQDLEKKGFTSFEIAQYLYVVYKFTLTTGGFE